jgi:putative phosphoesterase
METFVFANLKFVLLHGDEYWSWNENKWYERLKQVGKDQDADVVIFGHSHKEYIDADSKPYLINPGSISLPRNDKMHKSYLIMEIDGGKMNFLIKHI